MRQSFRRAGLLALAALLTLAGTVSLTGTASASRQPDTLRGPTTVQDCPFPAGCVQDTRQISGAVVTFCFFDVFHLTYSTSSPGRGGFVSRSLLTNPGRQPDACATRGTPIQVKSSVNEVNLSSCAGTCVNFGTAQRLDRGGAWCHLPPDRHQFILVYMNRINRAGFIPASALNGVPNVPSCNG